MKIVPLSIIAKVIAEYYNCEQIDIFAKNKKSETIIRRQWFHYLSRTLNPMYIVSLDYIASYLSYETKHIYKHATIKNSVKRMAGFIETYPSFKKLELEFLLKIKEKYPKNESFSYIKTFSHKRCEPMVFKIEHLKKELKQPIQQQ
jgi:hypothetical protein